MIGDDLYYFYGYLGISIIGSGCSTCNDGADLGSVRVRIGMGNGTDGQSLGQLLIESETPTPDLAKPILLNFADDGVIRKDNAIRQIKLAQIFADVVTSTEYMGYEVRIYSTSQSGDISPTTGLYTPTGDPKTIWRIENPDGDIAHPNASLTRLKVTKIEGSQTSVNMYEYTASTNTWSLSQGVDGEKKAYKSDVWDEAHLNHTITTTVCNAEETVIYKEQNFYYAFPWGENLVKTVVDPDGVALTTTYSYYEDSAATGSYSEIKLMVTPTGYWEHYYYDSAGRTVKTVSQFKSSVIDSAEILNRVSTTSYQDSEPQETHIETVLGQEVARSYTVNRHESATSDLITLNIQCQSLGAAYTATDNLVTTTVTDSSGGAFDGKVKSITTPDGSVTQYHYLTNADNSVTETIIQPNGIQTLTTTASDGRIMNIITKTDDVVISTANNTEFDDTGRVTRTDYEDGTYETTIYGCCGVDNKRDRRGIVTSYSYDDFKRVKTETSNGITLIYDYDANGNRTKTTRQGTDGSQIVTNQSFYDVAGRLWKTIDAANNPTLYSQTQDDSGNTVKTTTYADAGTRIETYYKDGQLLSVAGTAVQPLKYEYGADSSGLFTKKIQLGDNEEETEWSTTWKGLNGDVAKVTHSGTPEATTNYYYNAKGQLYKVVDPDGVATLYAYNAVSGERETTAIDMDRNGVIDFSGTDRITKVVNSIVSGSSGFGLQRTTTTVWNKDNINTSIESVTQSTSGGLETWATNSGLTTHTVTVTGTDGLRTTTTNYPNGSSAIQIYSGSQLMSQTLRDSSGNQISAQTYHYDAHGRQDKITDARNGETSFTYYDTDLVHTVTTPLPGDGSPAQTTIYEYDSMGHKTTETQPDGGVVNCQYYLTGALKHTDGARVYTSDYTYDAQGRMKTLATTTGTTTWTYYPDSGLLHTKVYPDEKGPTYAYTTGGRLLTRTWARGIVTTYGHNNAGETDSITYSDNITPTITVHYNRLGKLDTATDASGSRTLSFKDDGQADTETFTDGMFSGLSLVNHYDNYFRRDDYTLKTGSTTLMSQGYGYDNASRLQTASQGLVTGTYNYEPNSSLVSTVTLQNNGNTLTTSKTYDALNRLKTITASVGSQTVSSYGYSYNSANQRTRVDLADGSHVAYGYDTLGQVTSSNRYWPGDIPVAGQQYAYQFDGIGNRLQTTVNGRQSDYVPDALNQYSTRTVPNALDILGSAAPAATVTLNDKAVTRQQGGYFAGQVNVNNSTGPVYAPINIVGVKAGAGAGGKDIVTTSTGNLFVAKTPESFFYDLDGNLTSDGRWTYTWDGENRLIGMEAQANVPAAAKQKLTFSYDYQGRRVQKSVYHWNVTTGAYETAAAVTTRFLYDGWNLVAEVDSANAITRSYLWGLDLSNTAQGAGGVGGLLAVTTTGSNAGSYAYTYDGNGNVSDLVSQSGTAVAHYEYGPFGEPLRVSGAMAAQNPFRFSTKYTDDEMGLVYYGYRYYNPSTGRWVNRDPSEEDGGMNLYGFCINNGVCLFDTDGQGIGPGYGVAGLPNGIVSTPPNQGSTGDSQARGAISGFANGTSSTSRSFGPGDPWTQQMAQHEHMTEVRDHIRQKMKDHCCGKNKLNLPQTFPDNWELNSQSILTNARIYLRDIFAGAGLTDASWSTGSYRLQYTIKSITCGPNSANVDFKANDTLSLHSATRIPKTRIGLPNNPFGSQNAPFNNVNLEWTWNETVK